jgi:hypothetical protein
LARIVAGLAGLVALTYLGRNRFGPSRSGTKSRRRAAERPTATQRISGPLLTYN